jgi:hypothetical protein
MEQFLFLGVGAVAFGAALWFDPTIQTKMRQYRGHYQYLTYEPEPITFESEEKFVIPSKRNRTRRRKRR